MTDECEFQKECGEIFGPCPVKVFFSTCKFHKFAILVERMTRNKTINDVKTLLMDIDIDFSYVMSDINALKTKEM